MVIKKEELDRWTVEEQGKHFCHCGCGHEIIIKRNHHSNGIPKYVIGHSKKGMVFSRVDDWIKMEQERYFCQCGCGREIIITREHYYKTIPKFIGGHQRKGVKHTEMAKEKIREKRKDQIFTKETKHKMSEAHKGEKHWNYGGRHSEETRKKMRDNHADVSLKNNPWYGKHPSEETRKKMSEARKGKHLSKKTKEKLRIISRKKRKHQVFPNHHTKPELIFEEICKKYDLHFKYTGDGSLWIGKEEALNPDFIQADGQKIIVEIFGDWWHSPLLNQKLPKTANLNYRKKFYKKLGWKSYFIWETDLLRPDAEQFVLNTLAEVCNTKK